MERKIVDYKILLSVDINQLMTSVQKEIKDGWEPSGGICLYNRGVCQAIVKYEGDK